MRTGGLSTTTGLYRSDCTCAAMEKVPRGETAPACPICRQAVVWSYIRSEYIPPPLDEVEEEATSPPADAPDVSGFSS